jgi:hypothetical protein
MEIVFEGALVDTQKTTSICSWTWVLFFFDIVLSLVYKTFVHVSVHLFASSGMACAECIFTVNCLTGSRYKWRYKRRIRNVFLSRHYWPLCARIVTYAMDCPWPEEVGQYVCYTYPMERAKYTSGSYLLIHLARAWLQETYSGNTPYLGAL